MYICSTTIRLYLLKKTPWNLTRNSARRGFVTFVLSLATSESRFQHEWPQFHSTAHIHTHTHTCSFSLPGCQFTLIVETSSTSLKRILPVRELLAFCCVVVIFCLDVNLLCWIVVIFHYLVIPEGEKYISAPSREFARAKILLVSFKLVKSF